jgi:hypothetical protein
MGFLMEASMVSQGRPDGDDLQRTHEDSRFVEVSMVI